MLFDAGGHNQCTNVETAWFLDVCKGSEKEVSQCNVCFMEGDITNFGRLQLQVTINSLVWQQSRQLKPSIKLSMLFLVNVL